ncbi:MAG: Gfo/Idh/MocA family oxidoreductase [Chloroflexota bacterium]
MDIAGWVDVREGVAGEAAAQLELDGVHAGSDLGKALGAVRPDFVLDVTSPEAHHDVTLQSLAAGIPVLGEKPMADSMEHARAMVAASERTGTLYMVSQNRTRDPGFRALRRLISEHTGDVGILHSDYSMGVHVGGFREEMPSPLLLDMAIHTFDAARYLSGADPVSVYCEEINPPWSWYQGNAAATAMFEMTGNLHYTYRGSWCSDGLPTSYEGQWRAVGPHGSAVWDGEGTPVAEVVVATGGYFSDTRRVEEPRDDTVASGWVAALDDFLHALKTGETPMGECHDNIKSLAMVFGAIESARTGRRVPIHI